MIFWPFLGTITYPKTTFASMSPYFNVKLSLFLTEVSFKTSEENQLSYFHNGYFFKILWWSHEPHYKGICRWKNKIIFQCFTINNHGFSFVSFSTNQTLVVEYTKNVLCLMSKPKLFRPIIWNISMHWEIYEIQNC